MVLTGRRTSRASYWQRLAISGFAHQALGVALVCALVMVAEAACFSPTLRCWRTSSGPVLQVGRKHSFIAPATPPSTSFGTWALVGTLAVCMRRLGRPKTWLKASDRDFDKEQLKLRVDQLLHKNQSVEEEKQKALDRVKPLEKTVKDLQSELQEIKKQSSDFATDKLQESARLKEALETARQLEQEKEEALLQNNALDKKIKDLKSDLQESQERKAAEDQEKQRASSQLQEALQAAQRFQQENDKAQARVRSLEKAVEDTKRDVATSQQDLKSTKQDGVQARATSDDLEEEKEALQLRLQRFTDAMRNITELASSALNDPENDPFVLLEKATKAAAASDLLADKCQKEAAVAVEKCQKQAAVAVEKCQMEAAVAVEQRDEALARLEALELRSKSLEQSEERAQELSKLLQDVADAAGAGPGMFGLFQAKKSDKDMAADIKARIKDLKQQR